jgi:flagellar protein FliT
MAYQNSLHIYNAIETLSNQMLAAAKKEDWEKLVELEKNCAQHVQQLKYYQNVLPLSKDLQEQKKSSIQRILANDSQIRDLVSPQMASLSALISSTQNGKKLSSKYNE